jgi:hypothetical protein
MGVGMYAYAQLQLTCDDGGHVSPEPTEPPEGPSLIKPPIDPGTSGGGFMSPPDLPEYGDENPYKPTDPEP